MKKTYSQPAIELVAVELEQGIAQSLQEMENINDIYLNEENLIW